MSVRVWGPALSPWLVCPVRGVRCQAPSLPRLPVLGGGQPGFRGPCVPGAVVAGMGAQHRPHSVRPCGPALRAVGVAEGRPRGGGTVRRREGRLRSGAPPPTARPPGGLSGSATVPWVQCNSSNLKSIDPKRHARLNHKLQSKYPSFRMQVQDSKVAKLKLS